MVRQSAVYILDDDTRFLRALDLLLSAHGYRALTYSSAKDFLETKVPSGPGCLILDLRMPEISGMEVQRLLAKRSENLPVIFLSGEGDIPTSVSAIKEGAVDFLTKPCDEKKLLTAIDTALALSLKVVAESESLRRDRVAFDSLSHRERQVCLRITQGLLNKQIAAEFGTTESTIKVQRGQVMRKLAIGSVADMVKLVERLRAAGQLQHISDSPMKTVSKKAGQ